MTTIRLSPGSDTPIYKQIVAQVRFMIEGGQLSDGDRLPSSRMLADNLKVNRNTVARAYRELRDIGLIESRRRSGMVVTGARSAREQARARERARSLIANLTHECIELGLSAEEVSSLAFHFAMHAEEARISICFVECNEERARYFADELSERLGQPVEPLVLGQFDPQRRDEELVLTTFFHLTEVRRSMRRSGREIIAIVVAPHVRTLVQLAKVPKDRRVGILYSTEEQAQGIQDSLVQSGIENVDVLHDTSREALAEVDVVVVPSEMPELAEELRNHVKVVEFGNVLDESSLRMVSAVLDEMRDAKVGAGASGNGHAERRELAPAIANG
ncbi:MAG: GntR family transcriptional regulator [Solirubrobacterales bacterium]